MILMTVLHKKSNLLKIIYVQMVITLIKILVRQNNVAFLFLYIGICNRTIKESIWKQFSVDWIKLLHVLKKSNHLSTHVKASSE